MTPSPNKPLSIPSPVLVLVGPTAIGKTALSFEIVRSFDCEIISMDSMQVYRQMDIGTAKPSPAELASVPHHLIDILDPDEQYNAARFVQDCLAAVQDILSRGRLPLITGGTGLYLNALKQGIFSHIPIRDEVKAELLIRLKEQGRAVLYQELCTHDPDSAARIHPNDQQRILRGLEIYYSTGIPWAVHLERQRRQAAPVQFDCLLEIGLHCERSVLYQRIAQRTKNMLQQGFVEEVKGLRERGYPASLPSMQAIGYHHVNQFLDGKWSFEEMEALLIRDTRRYAKRQRTWFRKNETLHWYEREESASILRYIKRSLL